MFVQHGGFKAPSSLPSLRRHQNTSCASCNLRKVVELAIHRALEEFELQSLRARIQQASLSGKDVLAVDEGYSSTQIADVLLEWQSRQPEHVKVLTRRDYCFALVHGRQSRLEVLAGMRRSLRLFIGLHGAIVPLAIATLAVAVTEHSAVGLFFGDVTLAICAGLLLCLAALGCGGGMRLRTDLRADDDGKETPAQRMLEGYFWAGALLCLVILATAAAHLVGRSHVPAMIEDRAQRFPTDFEALARAVGVEPRRGSATETEGTAIRAVIRAVQAYQLTTSLVATATALALAAALIAAGRIVTTFEIAQGLLYVAIDAHRMASSSSITSQRLLRPLPPVDSSNARSLTRHPAAPGHHRSYCHRPALCAILCHSDPLRVRAGTT